MGLFRIVGTSAGASAPAFIRPPLCGLRSKCTAISDIWNNEKLHHSVAQRAGHSRLIALSKRIELTTSTLGHEHFGPSRNLNHKTKAAGAVGNPRSQPTKK